jgi:hypothetical protein
MAKDPAILAHQEWLGYVQPTGLVVSIPALLEASAIINRNFGPDHQRFLAALPQNSEGENIPEIPDFIAFARDVLGWDTAFVLGAPGSDPVPPELEVVLENYNETLRPTYALRNFIDGKPIMLVYVLPNAISMDEVYSPHDRGWQASPQARFERLLRQAGVATGLLVNGREIRLVYAPEKELSGHITFKLADMVQVAGRPILAALIMLIGSERLYSVADKERLPAILANSRKYQNVVSTQLAEQVLEALYELLRGFQAANDQTKSELLRDVLARDPDHVYHGLLTTLLRLVFILYAEDRGLLSTDPIYSNHYSVTGLYERLRADAGRYNDTMDQRYGAWAQLLALFRLIYSGGRHGAMKIPAREGYLFDHDRYLFLEGRHDKKDKPVIPRVSDGVVYRVLSKLLLLDGERLSYRTLAVEQIGSVYQAIMGFSLRVATGRSIAIKPAKKHGAPATINLEELLSTSGDQRSKKFTEETDQKLSGNSAEAIKAAKTIEELLAAFNRKIALSVTPVPVMKGAMVFQPSNERRKSGSHYTPTTLTGPIVEAALQPVLKQLGPKPTPAKILNLKVCDPAMGSAAFLVEACRQLGDALVEAWHAHGETPVIPPDEDEALYAHRIVAQRCLYGLDKNLMATDLAKLSLWLATLAKDHPFTFLDHSLRHGDALVGLTRKQIASFHWAPSPQQTFLEENIGQLVEFVSRQRREILEARENTPYAQLEQELAVADERLSLPRMIGDAAIAAFFSAEKSKQREQARKRLLGFIEADLKRQGFISVDGEVNQAIQALREGPKGVTPFHWELEFPEVFTTDKGNVAGGFDVIVGNPPFAGKNMFIETHPNGYLEWLQELHVGAHGNADLVAHFFRRAFSLLRDGGCFGLIATNTIGQGDTRSTGLQWICKNQGTIYRAVKRIQWPGEAAVMISVIHIAKGTHAGPYMLNGRAVPSITAFLFHAGGNENPISLRSNSNLAFKGAEPGSLGFLVRTGDAEFDSLSKVKDPRNCHTPLLKPYFTGADLVNGASSAWILDVDGLTSEQLHSIPQVLDFLTHHVRPDLLHRRQIEIDTAEWWHFRRPSRGLQSARTKLKRILTLCRVSGSMAFVFASIDAVVNSNIIGFAYESSSAFAVLQSRVHEVWARLLSSSLKDDLLYAPSDCFDNFPFPLDFEERKLLYQAGEQYYDFRAGIMNSEQVGLTVIYNWFHDPSCAEPAVLTMRELQNCMDRAVLDAYGWTDIRPSCEFIPEFDDEDEEENGRQYKKKFRYRWPDDMRDEVLSRLLELNRRRALEDDQLLADAVEPMAKNRKGRKKKLAADAGAAANGPLFTSQKGDN